MSLSNQIQVRMKKVGITLLAGFAGGVLAITAFRWMDSGKPNYQIIQAAPPTYNTSYEHVAAAGIADFTAAAERTVNTVVHIKTVALGKNARNADPFQGFFGNPFGGWGAPPRTGSGSGVIISPNGYIITNNHVIEGADEIQVILNDKREYKAQVVGSDPNTDLAVIRIDEDNLPAIVFANSDQVKVGEWALAIGNPMNLSSTVTAGIISAKGRNIDIIRENYKIESFIQTDAAVNPGNSGGALVNLHGELIGINTAIASNTGAFSGYSFAIPSNLARKVAQDIMEYGNVQRGVLGVNIREVNSGFAKEKNISTLRGVWVESPFAGSAAEEAGIQSGDIILKVNDTEVNSPSELQEQIGLHRPGDKVDLTILRGNTTKVVRATLKNKNGSTNLLDRYAEISMEMGAGFEDVSAEEKQRFGIQGGVKVTALGQGKLQMVGIRPGFIITEANGKKVRNMDEFYKAVGKSRQLYIGGFYPTGERVYYSFN